MKREPIVEDFSFYVSSIRGQRFSSGEIKSRQARLGKPVDDFDFVIVATAETHNLAVATLNKRHFKLIEGLEWEDWSKA